MSQFAGYRDLKVFQLAYALAMEVFQESKKFPVEERYSLTDQLRRSSRSVPANLAEGWKKRRYQKAFVNKVLDAAGEAGECEVWIDMAMDCGYMQSERHRYFRQKYDELNAMLFTVANMADRFCK